MRIPRPLTYGLIGAAAATAVIGALNLAAADPGPLTVSLQNGNAPLVDGAPYWAGAPLHTIRVGEQLATANPWRIEQVGGGEQRIQLEIPPLYQRGGGQLSAAVCYGVGCEATEFTPITVARPSTLAGQASALIPYTQNGDTTVRLRVLLAPEGFGAGTTGSGSDASIYEVTSLACSGDGSIGGAVEAARGGNVFINILAGGEQDDCGSVSPYQITGEDITVYSLAAPQAFVIRGASLTINPLLAGACQPTGNVLVAGPAVDKLRKQTSDGNSEAVRIEMGASTNECPALEMTAVALMGTSIGNCRDDCLTIGRGDGRLNGITLAANRFWGSSDWGIVIQRVTGITAYLNHTENLRNPLHGWRDTPSGSTETPRDADGNFLLGLHWIYNFVTVQGGQSVSQVVRGGTWQSEANFTGLTESGADDRRLLNQHQVVCSTGQLANPETNTCDNTNGYGYIGPQVIWARGEWYHWMGLYRLMPPSWSNHAAWSPPPLSMQLVPIDAAWHTLFMAGARTAADISRFEAIAAELEHFQAETIWTDNGVSDLSLWGSPAGLTLAGDGYEAVNDSASHLYSAVRDDQDTHHTVEYEWAAAPASTLSLFSFVDAQGSALGTIELLPDMRVQVRSGNQTQRLGGNKALRLDTRYELRLRRIGSQRFVSGAVRCAPPARAEDCGLTPRETSEENALQNTPAGNVAQIVYGGFDAAARTRLYKPASCPSWWCSQGGGTPPPPDPSGPTGPTGPTGPLPPTANFSGEFLGRINDDGNVVDLRLNVTEQQE